MATYGSPLVARPDPRLARPSPRWRRALSGAYLFNEPGLLAVRDIQGAYPGTLTPGSAWTWTAGSYGPQLQFATGSSQYLNLGGYPPLSAAPEFTVAILAAMASYAASDGTGNNLLFAAETSGTGECRFGYFQPTGMIFFQLGADAAYPNLAAPPPPLNLPVVFTARLTAAGTRSMWFGACKVDERTDAGIAYPTTGALKGIGGSPQSLTRGWQGPVMTAYIWTRALADPEIVALAADPFVPVRPPRMSAAAYGRADPDAGGLPAIGRITTIRGPERRSA